MIRIPGKIPIMIHPLFWVMAFAIGFLSSHSTIGTLIWVAVIFVSVLVHELGHALTGLAYGQKVVVNLIAMGGLTQRQGPPLKLSSEFFVVLNGPLAGLFLYFVASELLQWTGEDKTLWSYALMITGYVNLFWTLVNLLPIQPLDGGKLLVIVCEGLMGFKGVRIALFISLIVAVGIGLLFFSIGAIVPGALFFLLAFESFRTWRGSMAMSEKDRDLELQSVLQAAQEDLQSHRMQQAEEKLCLIRSRAERGFLHLAASELLADLLAERGEYEEAYKILAPLQSSLSPPGLQLLHRLAYKTEHWDHAANLGGQAYQNVPSYEVAMVNAFSHAMKQEVEPTIGWLRCAMREGLPDINQALQCKEFDGVRGDPSFKAFVSSMNL